LTRLRLEFLSGPRRGDTSVFSSSTVSLGRSRSNTLVLSDTVAPAASGHHADFVHEGQRWWVVDCDSTNGTYLNDVRVTRASLSSGDRVTLGDLELRVQLVGAASTRTVLAARGALLLVAVGVAAAVYWAMIVRPGSPQHIADIASHSVFLVAVDRGASRSSVGTAFAVDRGGWLATNAHVAALLEDLVNRGSGAAKAVAVHGDSYEALGVDAIVLHPEWQPGSIAHDVALLHVDVRTPSVPLPLASPEQVQALRRGTSLSTFGFPAASTDAAKPRGRLSVDVLSDIRLPFLEVGLGIAPGTSGSPVFGPAGGVVGVVVSGDFVRGPADMPMRPSGSNVNWAISADELRDLMVRRLSAQLTR
jgi:S1-C subfamily serine protease